MKKILILLFSLLISVNSLSETYVCAFTCYTSTTEICQMSYKRINNSFVSNPGEKLFNLKENNKFISLSENSINSSGEGAGVSVAIINKKDLSFITSRTQLIDDLPSRYKRNLAREGNCILVN